MFFTLPVRAFCTLTIASDPPPPPTPQVSVSVHFCDGLHGLPPPGRRTYFMNSPSHDNATVRQRRRRVHHHNPVYKCRSRPIPLPRCVGRSGARSDRWTAHENIAKLAKSPERAGTREPRRERQGPGEPAVATPPAFDKDLERKRLAPCDGFVI